MLPYKLRAGNGYQICGFPLLSDLVATVLRRYPARNTAETAEVRTSLAQHNAMVKALRFKGDKKVKKRKRAETEDDNAGEGSSSKVAKQQEGEEAEGWVDSESSG